MASYLWGALLGTTLLVLGLWAIVISRRARHVLAALALAVLVFGTVGDLVIYSGREALMREGSYAVMKNIVRAMEALGALGFLASLVAAHFTGEKPEAADLSKSDKVT